MNAQVTTVIVNWNRGDLTAACLESLRQTDYPTHIIVVDNGSQDGSVERLCTQPLVEFIPLPENRGFASACNLAVRRGLEAGSRYFLLLNNDTTVHPDFYRELVAAAEANPQAGILGPKVYEMARPRRIWHAGARQRRWVLAAADLGRGQIDRGQFEEPRWVDFVYGCGMLIRREVLERVGLLDPHYFLYLEDLDLCLRARQSGYHILFVPQAQMWHQIYASTAHQPALRKYYWAESTLYFLHKHASPRQIPAIVAFWSLVLIRELIREMLGGNLDGIRGYFSGLYQGWKHIRFKSYRPNSSP